MTGQHRPEPGRRRIWGDLLPITEYRNGNDGRHGTTSGGS